MAKISDVYAGDYVSASELPDGRRIAAVVMGAVVEAVGQEQQKKVVLTLAAPDGRPWPRRMVLNKTNAGILAAMYGDETTPWTGRHIEVWKEPTQFQGKIVPGIKLAAAAPPPLAAAGTGLAIPMPAPAAAPGNGTAAPLWPSPPPPAPVGEIDDEIPF